MPGDAALRGAALTAVTAGGGSSDRATPSAPAVAGTAPTPVAAPPLIVSLRFDAEGFAVLDRLRRAHFPPERNVLAAHLTLFHALPGAREPAVREALATLAAAAAPLPIRFAHLRSLGRGVALAVDAPALAALRAAIADRFASDLTRQDAQAWRPHVTLQNKVDPAIARRTLESLSSGFQPWTATGLGLDLWRYRGGPWEAVATALFSAPSSGASSSGGSPHAPARP